MYRPQIKVVDCTIRDGGLMNNSKFPKAMVRNVFKALNDSGIDIVELGYRNSKEMFSTSEYGPWRFCDDELLKEVTDGIDRKVKIAVMQDAHKSISEDVLPKEESIVDMIRVATYVKDVDKAINLANNATDKGYEATINIMAISHALDRELNEALQQIEEETDIEACYIVDSFGALYSEDIDYFVEKFKKYIKTKEVGIHAHNHQQLGFANTIEGIIKGTNYLDGTLYGFGRAAGNCPLEVLVAFLKNPKFNIQALLDVIGKEIMPLTKKIEWGYKIPYMISGILNIHPREAMAIMNLPTDDPKRYNFKEFYEEMAKEDIA
ncbi:MAG: aldolase catalytic domain-containing protein [Elusimicrobia bacterium]|jgi:4-hydroxy 2-oxovalerate aldolase|nr:aldolase catalytic domain-containing protein [Elusimicrobiota bacterium]